ncbi:MAG TPA: MATE family efflux transporter [Eubacteriaceae bacterium]|nr:MATE family efflux transporter [Eubacteriaceae bacterium]
MVVTSLYNFVDRIFIGNAPDLGANGLAGITISFPVMILMMALGILFGVGGATLFSIKLGEGKKDVAEKALGNALGSLLIAALVYCIVGQIFMDPILRLFGASDTILPYARDYMRVIFIGAIFMMTSLGMNNFIRADGNPKVAMITMFFGAGLNIILDPIFIFGLNMGMTGAALATALAQLASFLWIMRYFLKDKGNVKLNKAYIKPEWSIVKQIVSLGTPGFALQLANSLLNTVLNRNLLLLGGDIAVGGMGIINSLMALLLMPVIGLRQGVQPIISFNYGAQNYDRVKTATKQSIFAGTGIVLAGYTLTRIFPEELILMFNQNPDLVEFGVYALGIWFLFLPVVGFQIVASNFFQAIGRPKSAMILTLSRQAILLIPALFIFPIFWGMEGLLHAAPFADFFSAAITGVWFFRSVRNLEADEEKKRLRAQSRAS